MDEPGAQAITFEAFPKIARLNRDCVITEKLDGTNAQVIVTEDGRVAAASRSRIITPDDDNFGFAAWVERNVDELRKLGPGRHFGEWWGSGIQRGYGLMNGDRRFSLFNVGRWYSGRPLCCHVVPILYTGPFKTEIVDHFVESLRKIGSHASPGFMKPEGIIVWHEAARQLFKVTLEKDEVPKALAGRAA
jgi:hypothetical protein